MLQSNNLSLNTTNNTSTTKDTLSLELVWLILLLPEEFVMSLKV